MKKFVKELFTNRFGIVLATLNISYFISNKFVNLIFSHEHGESCLHFKKHFLMFYPKPDAPALELLLNLPSIIASAIQGTLAFKMFPGQCVFTQLKIQIVFFTFFAALQWLFIAWLSYKIARKIRGN
jgi:hypothetical protein